MAFIKQRKDSMDRIMLFLLAMLLICGCTTYVRPPVVATQPAPVAVVAQPTVVYEQPAVVYDPVVVVHGGFYRDNWHRRY